MSCIGNSGPVWPEMHEIAGDIELTSVLSGNRNFDGRISPDVSQNFLCAPASVVAYAMAGTMNFDFETQPLGTDGDGNDVFLRDIWPSDAEIAALMDEFVTAELFDAGAEGLYSGTQAWQELEAPEGDIFAWDEGSTYVRRAPYFDGGQGCRGLRAHFWRARACEFGRLHYDRPYFACWQHRFRFARREVFGRARGRPGYVQHLRFASRQP